MKVANDNAKVWFGEIKKILEKEDTEWLPNDLLQVGVAKLEAKNKKLIRKIYCKLQESKGNSVSIVDTRVEKKQFVELVKLFLSKDVNIQDGIIHDMFLTFAKKLGQATPSPSAL